MWAGAGAVLHDHLPYPYCAVPPASSRTPPHLLRTTARVLWSGTHTAHCYSVSVTLSPALTPTHRLIHARHRPAGDSTHRTRPTFSQKLLLQQGHQPPGTPTPSLASKWTPVHHCLLSLSLSLRCPLTSTSSTAQSSRAISSSPGPVAWSWAGLASRIELDLRPRSFLWARRPLAGAPSSRLMNNSKLSYFFLLP